MLFLTLHVFVVSVDGAQRDRRAVPAGKRLLLRSAERDELLVRLPPAHGRDVTQRHAGAGRGRQRPRVLPDGATRHGPGLLPALLPIRSHRKHPQHHRAERPPDGDIDELVPRRPGGGRHDQTDERRVLLGRDAPDPRQPAGRLPRAALHVSVRALLFQRVRLHHGLAVGRRRRGAIHAGVSRDARAHAVQHRACARHGRRRVPVDGRADDPARAALPHRARSPQRHERHVVQRRRHGPVARAQFRRRLHVVAELHALAHPDRDPVHAQLLHRALAAPHAAAHETPPDVASAHHDHARVRDRRVRRVRHARRRHLDGVRLRLLRGELRRARRARDH